MVKILQFLASTRQWLAMIAGLRWARIGRIDPVVPVAIGLVIWNAVPMLGRDLAGIPFGVLWAAATAVVLALARLPRPAGLGSRSEAAGAPGGGGSTRTRTPVLRLMLPVGVVVSWVLYDVLFWGQTNQLYDLNVYLGSAARWLDGGQPYLTTVLTAWPSSPRADFFLYPPPLLPVFALLSKLPDVPLDVAWVAFLAGCAYKGYRLLGLPRIWSLALLAFPPMAIGFESGNVAAVTFLLFAAAVKAGGTLVVDGLFKIQTGLPALWLVRQRRWRGILAGAAAVAVVCLVTLPLVGFDSWFSWWEGLGYRAGSQAAVPPMYGYSEAKDLVAWVFVAISAGFVVLALLFRGRRGLAGLGLASVYASPALWPHGFVFALPALLLLENGAAVWLLLGVGAWGVNMWLLFYAGWLAVLAANRLPSGRLHPLAGTDGPWPGPPRPRPARRSIELEAPEPDHASQPQLNVGRG